MNWLLIGEIVYTAILIAVCVIIIYDSRNSAKAIAYVLLSIFVPFFGMIFYFSFGINRRKYKIYSQKLINDAERLNQIRRNIVAYSEESLEKEDASLQDNKELARLLLRDLYSPLTRKNKVKLLVNGENKFPEVLQAIKDAKHHIHIEYYIYDDDEIGRQLENLLIQKAKEGVQVRLIYDDFGSRSIRKKLVPRLKKGNVKAFPFYKIILMVLANRVNHRNHRKIIVIDGKTAFVGGINVSDRYINNGKKGGLFWRDTHLRIDGPGIFYLQYIFLCDWQFCSGETLDPLHYFSLSKQDEENQGVLLQIAASGPDSRFPSTLYAIIEAIYLAQEEILITTPYYIPGDNIQNALIIAALSGLKVKLLVPGVSDSLLVNYAAQSYYGELLDAGVEIYRYQKGFVHAKTIVVDSKLSIVGSANMDYRSFELNFEVNAVVYDKPFSEQLRENFFDDIKEATQLNKKEWAIRSRQTVLLEKVARLFSPLL